MQTWRRPAGLPSHNRRGAQRRGPIAQVDRRSQSFSNVGGHQAAEIACPALPSPAVDKLKPDTLPPYRGAHSMCTNKPIPHPVRDCDTDLSGRG